jgi:signal-transduction protein with cAMP-binding, CBS, and nucleotidyltransferase domain/PAS domain-containing protein
MKSLLKKSLLILKIDLPALLAVVLFAGLIFLYLIPGFETAMMERKRNLINEMTSSAYSLLSYYHSLEMKGLMNGDTARIQAMTAIGSIRYGESLKDYFWITDLHPKMIIHPYRTDLNGQDLTDFRDSGGKTIFVEFVRAATESGAGYVEYMWQWNDDSTRIVPKLSYVRLFEPWGWIIGTGIYIEDVRTEIRRMELRALIISGTIGLVIVILLSVISRQTHKIERKRKKAEKELNKSKELYRTLAEAASEGVLIWSEQGLQANKTLLSWLGYSEDELRNVSLTDVFITDWTEKPVDAGVFYDEMTTMRYQEGTLKTKTGQLLSSHADFSRILMGGLKAVLVVIRPVKASAGAVQFPSGTSIFENISVGFFRIAFGKKNRFIYATDATIKMLGYNTLQELVPHPVDSFFSDPGQLRAFMAALAAKELISGRQVLLRRKEGAEFMAIVNVIIIESGNHEIWCEGSVEPLAASSVNLNYPLAGLSDFSASYIMDAPASSIMRNPVFCPENLPAIRAISVMKENDIQIVVVTNQKGDPMGILDSSTIGFRLSEGESPDTELYRWMSSPPLFINRNARISEAFGMIWNSQNKCLLIASDEKMVAGIITNTELTNAFFTAPGHLASEIAQSTSSAAFRTIFISSRKLAMSMILGHADPYSVSLHLSDVADSIYQRILKLCIEETGTPPCRFAFILTGSAGRREPSLSTDQDNAIIFENLAGEPLKNAQNYFLTLGNKVNDLLAITGYQTCKGGNMAGNPRWCQPLNSWKKYFSDWIKMPGPEELLEVSIFFDFRFCTGDKALAEELRYYIQNDLKTSDIYFHHMTNAWKQYNPSVAMLLTGKTDVKRILMPLTGIIRLYALKYWITGLSTPERVIELYAAKHIDYKLLRDTLKAWKDLTSIRLCHQTLCISKGIDPDNIIDFQLIDSNLKYLAEQSIITINNLMLKAGSDFYTDTI